LEPLWLALFADGDAQRASAMEAARAGLALVEEQLKLKGKSFFGIAGGGVLAHWLVGVLEEVAGVSVMTSGEELPALHWWAAEYRSSEAVKSCLPDRARLLAHFAAVRDKCVSVANSMLPK
jgi:glutathione S-transferase